MYCDSTEQFFAGQWGGEPGAWEVVYAPHEEEFCLLLEGSVEIIPEGQTEGRRFEKGDAFVIPGGFRGIWRNIGTVRKYYATMNLKKEA